MENILLFCPNHHKEFDLGETEIKYQDKNKIIIIMNGCEKEIEL